MARPKRPRNETPEQIQIRTFLEAISNNASRSEKMSFDRKLKNMKALIRKLQPLEEQIIKLMAKKMPIIDEVTNLRKEMALTCVHPTEYLIYKGTFVECKFCSKTIALNQKK